MTTSSEERIRALENQVRLLEGQVRSHSLMVCRGELALRQIAKACLKAHVTNEFQTAVAEIAQTHDDWVSGKALVDVGVSDAFGQAIAYSECEEHGSFTCPGCRRRGRPRTEPVDTGDAR